MADRKLRRKIAHQAAHFLRVGQETELPRAKRLAARKLGFRFKPRDLPADREVRQQLDYLRQVLDAPELATPARSYRLQAIRLLRQLSNLEPVLVGVVCPCPNEPADVDTLAWRIDIHAVSPLVKPGRERLEELGWRPTIATLSQSVADDNPSLWEQTDPLPARLVLWRHADVRRQWLIAHRSTWLRPADLESALLDRQTPEDLDRELAGLDTKVDRFAVFRLLLTALEDIKQDPATHAEGDALHHSLQVFDLASRERGFDEELLTAALLHDAGQIVDRQNVAAESLALLDGLITDRTRWFIANLPEVEPYRFRELAEDHRLALRRHPDFEDLLLLSQLENQGRKKGEPVSSIDDALDYLRLLDNQNR